MTSSESDSGDDSVSGATEQATRDAALAARLRDGDVDAFTTLFRAYYATLVSFLRRYFESTSDAEDVAQDTMALLWERRQSIDPSRSVRALLFTTARNRALDHHRHLRHASSYADHVQVRHATGAAPADVSADAQLLADELDQVAAKHIDTLPPRQREIFQLSRGEGLAPAEIAEILGITTQTVYVQLGRISKSLYEALDSWTQG